MGTPSEIWRLDGIVAHLFNKHVMGDKPWSLQALADWVDEFEPTHSDTAVTYSHERQR
jgi:hypothetical protein